VPKDIWDQLSELQEVHKELTNITEKENEFMVAGSLPFEASADGFESISECFEVELIIPANYPENLPSVRETGEKIDSKYEHLYKSGKLCLGVPIEERRIFLEQPSLLGFVNNLLVPYLFGYCYWKQHNTHPFDESEHGSKGIVQHYLEKLELNDEVSVLAVISYLHEHGYRGHHSCPCGSGKKVRNCHAEPLRALNSQHTKFTLNTDLNAALEICLEKKYLIHFESRCCVF